jgi:hypothetical protein
MAVFVGVSFVRRVLQIGRGFDTAVAQVADVVA